MIFPLIKRQTAVKLNCYKSRFLGRSISFTAVCAGLILLCSCRDGVEMNDRAYVNSISIDKSDEHNDEHNSNGDGAPFMFTTGVSISDLEPHEGGDKGGEAEGKNKSLKTHTGQTVPSALRMAENNSSQKLFFGHLRASFFGEELLRDRKLFSEALDALERDKELSRKILVIACNGDASGVCGVKPEGEPSIGVFADKFFKENKSGETFRLTLEELIIKLKGNKNALIPKIKEDKGELRIGGAAVIKDLTLCGFLNEKETRGYLWQFGNIRGANPTVTYKGVSVPFNTLSHKNKISFHDSGHDTDQNTGDTLSMNVDIRLTGSITEYIFGEAVSEDKQLKDIEALVEREVEREANEVNELLLKTMKTDVENINAELKKKNYRLWLKYNKNWQDAFEKMIISVNVDAKIKDTGRIK